jgi:hypothetical protein
VVTVLRLPLEPQSDECRFYDDKVALLRFAEKLGSA